MYTLVARDGRGRVIAAIPVTRRPLTVGRATDCALVLPSTAVSRIHASVYMQPDGAVVIKDEKSANGVQVDGRYISGPTLVTEANQIAISEFQLYLETASQADAHAPATKRPPPSRNAVEREELETILEAQVGAGTLLAATSVQLVGRGGPFDGTVFSLNQPLMTVGRAEGNNEIVVDDPSISRRHAQIRLSATGDRFTVLDLRSSNGTFVDGQRVKRAECGDGAIVRFGDIAFKVTLVRQAQEKPRRRLGRRGLLLGGLIVVVLLVTVGVIAKLKQPKPPPPRKISAAARLKELQAKIQRFVDEGKRRLEQRQWNAAVQAFNKARDEDPLNKEAANLRETALAELKNEEIYKKGLELYSLGNKENLEKGKEVFLRVPSTSVYYREVRDKLWTINERLAENYRIEGVSRCKARYWEQCHQALCKFFELLPEGKMVPGESRLREDLQEVIKRLGRRKDFVPCEAHRFLHPQGETSGETPEDVLAEKYEEKAIRDVLLLYFNGRIENALKRLVKLINDRRMRPHWATLREINRQLLIIRGKYQEGYSAHRERNADEAAKHWGMVLAADAALIPPRIESFYRREVKRALGDLYFDLGADEFKVLRYPQAYAHWAKGKSYNDAHERILNGLLQLEAVAERLVRQGRQLREEGKLSDAREKLETARKITAENRPVHQEALEELSKL